MRLTIQLKDGRQYPFAIAEGQACTDFFQGLKYWEIYDRPILRVHDGQDAWAFNPCAIEKIQFEGIDDPGWRPSENVLSAKCITQESYQRKVTASTSSGQKSVQSGEEGEVFESVLKIGLASGAVEYFECMLMLRSRRERLINLYNLFQKVAYTIPCESGGFVLLNPKNIVCIQLHPCPPEESDSAWRVEAYVGQDL